ncbi:MAG: hypothetical protein SVQ76_02460 [Candidatus Nanohaloarchaea archaeon]|nr:hypothetical protein [Candidatus Nanohaloarchaea archaeon]
MEIASEDYVSPAEVLERLDGLEERNTSQDRALEYMKKHLAVKDPETVEKLLEELEDLESLKRKHRLKIIETLPRSEAEVKALFSKERVKLDDSEVERIIDFSESVLA